VVTERLLDDDRGALDEAGGLDALDEGREGGRRNRQIHDAALLGGRRADRGEAPVRREGDEPQSPRERGKRRLLQRCPRELLDRRLGEVAETLIVPVERRRADDVALDRQQLLAVEVVERWDELALRQIAGGADDDDVLIGRRVERHRLRVRSATGR